MKISHIAATAHASLLYPVRTLSLALGGVLCSLALTAQKTAKQHIDADTHTAVKVKNMILMNLARGMRPCDTTDINAER